MPPAVVDRRRRCRASIRSTAGDKGRRYPADPPTVEEIVAVMRQAGTTPHGLRMRGLIVALWRAGLRIHEALRRSPRPDLDARRGSVLVRRGKGGRRREVGMNDWAWEQLQSKIMNAAAARPVLLRIRHPWWARHRQRHHRSPLGNRDRNDAAKAVSGAREARATRCWPKPVERAWKPLAYQAASSRSGAARPAAS